MNAESLRILKSNIADMEKKLSELRTDYNNAKLAGISLPELEEQINDYARKIQVIKLAYKL